jgi:hypothetical protein
MISAKIIKDSISPAGKRITTYELEYPRFIHSELLTHRVFSKNSASSRAIPIWTMIKMVWGNPAMPVHWGKYQTGMVANEELTGWRLWAAKKLWVFSSKVACVLAFVLWKVGLAKQIVNRILEFASHIKVILTGTEFDNFFHLRRDPAAQPEIHKLADDMYDAREASVPEQLGYGEWHLPYLDICVSNPGEISYEYVSGDIHLKLDDARKVSASLCAQVSYRKADDSLEKALKVYDRLVNSKPVHASPFEHQATPLSDPNESSGNFKGWGQFRDLIKNNVYTE